MKWKLSTSEGSGIAKTLKTESLAAKEVDSDMKDFLSPSNHANKWRPKSQESTPRFQRDAICTRCDRMLHDAFGIPYKEITSSIAWRDKRRGSVEQIKVKELARAAEECSLCALINFVLTKYHRDFVEGGRGFDRLGVNPKPSPSTEDLAYDRNGTSNVNTTYKDTDLMLYLSLSFYVPSKNPQRPLLWLDVGIGYATENSGS